MKLIHVMLGGPVYRLRCGKWRAFEDHPYCGPIFIGKDGDPLDVQPSERDAVWSHVNAWYQQGKQALEVAGEKWAVYKTNRHNTLREVCAARRATTGKEPTP